MVDSDSVGGLVDLEEGLTRWRGDHVQVQVPFQGACQLQLFYFLAPLAEDWATFALSLATFAVP